jgi:hypothetical protein
MIASAPQTIAAVQVSRISPQTLELDRLAEPTLNIRAINADPESATPSTFVDWLKNQVNVTTGRIDRAQKVERKLREQAILQATICWDSDRRIEAEILGAKLEKDPTEVVAGLRLTPQGCDWLLKRWALLIHAAEKNGLWSFDQALLASRMLGTPNEFQNEANPLETIRLEGRPIRTSADLAALGRREVKQLIDQRDQVAPVDEAAKLLAQKDELADDARSNPLRHLGRHERGLYLHLRWLVRQIEELSSDEPSSTREPRTVEVQSEATEAENEATVSVKDDPEAPADVEERPDVPCPSDRQESRLKKADARREARSRKLERRRS